MHRRNSRYVLPLLGLAALGLAFGIAALAPGGAGSATPVYQQKCQTGAIKAIVVVTGNNKAGIGGIPDQYTSDASLFGVRWSCSAKTSYQVRRVDRGVYDLKLNGNPTGTALVNSFGDARGVGVIRQPDGAFRVSLTGIRSGGDYGGLDNAFVLIGF